MGKPAFTEYTERLMEHRRRLEQHSTTDLFAKDGARTMNFCVRQGSLLLDYSKNRVDRDVMNFLVEIAGDLDVAASRDEMFDGAIANRSENRPALHTALRNSASSPILVDGSDILPGIADTIARMEAFSDAVRCGSYTVSGGAVTDIVNVGIGGSDLGPKMVVEALAPYNDGPKLHFVSNVDGADISDTLSGLNPETTLFVIVSKSFTTLETMTNANSALKWVEASVGTDASKHFVAVSTNLAAVSEFGIAEERVFGFGNWVGGRYSVWSAVGLSVMLAIGKKAFAEFLDGGSAMDLHFREAPFEENMPLILAMLGVWHRNICGFSALAVLPYDNRLQSFPRWMQQLDMESNGKSVKQDGSPVGVETAPIVFGEPGTNGQHAFYQSLHQGSDVVPCDFLVAARENADTPDHHHQLLFSSCLAQSEALMCGQTLEEAGGDPHRVFEGNRPSNTLLYRELDPHTLGQLMALYEHKIFVQGIIWGINSFDQWGVELGKQIAGPIAHAIKSEEPGALENPSTRRLLSEFLKLRK